MSEPTRTHTTSWYRKKAKELKRKDNINVAGLQMKVLSNTKNSFGERVITAVDFKKSLVTLILPKNLQVRACKCTTKVNKKTR